MPKQCIAYNDPLHTDREPYGNRISVIDRDEIPALMRRWHPESKDQSDEQLIDEFIVVNWAWEIDEPEWMNPKF